MLRKPISKRTRPRPKTVLRLPDLDQAKSAVLNSLTSTDAQRGYRHAIDEFVDWYCSEPRLSFNKTVVITGCIWSREISPLGRSPPAGVRSRTLRPPQRRLGGLNQVSRA